MLLYQGTMLTDSLRGARVTEEEILAAVRATGILDLASVEAVVLETDGSFSVVQKAAGVVSSSLASVMRPDRLA